MSWTTTLLATRGGEGVCEGVKGPGLRGPKIATRREGRLHGMIRFLTGSRKEKRERKKSNEGKERQSARH